MVLVLDGKNDLNQISLTGVRAITLIGLLSIGPLSLNEIRQKFLDFKIMDPSQSNDIIRVDMYTIKSFGCEIRRINTKNGPKYYLSKNPFNIPINEEDVEILKKLLSKIKNVIPISKLLECDKFIKKIAQHVNNSEIKEKLLGVSPLIHYDSDIINELSAACANRYLVKLLYNKQYEQKPSEKEIVAYNLVLKNDKLYLYGYDTEKQESVTLLFKRIKSVISKHINRKDHEQKVITVRFLLKNLDMEVLTDEEKIIEISGNTYLIEGRYFNEFLATQRILSFGSKCTVKEPLEFRNKIISKLKEMRKLYENAE